MSTDRYLSYKGRFWALKFSEGALTSVHHFESEEICDGWVAMDPQNRAPVSAKHKAVRAWIKQGPQV